MKKTSFTNLKPKYKWNDLSKELQSHFFNCGLISILILLVTLLSFLFLPSSVGKICLFTLIAFSAWHGYHFLHAIYGNVLIFIGKVEKMDLQSKKIGFGLSKKEIYGMSSMTMLVSRKNDDGSSEEGHFIVPIGYRNNISEGSTAIVFVQRNNVWAKNTNTYIINSPIIVKELSS